MLLKHVSRHVSLSLTLRCTNSVVLVVFVQRFDQGLSTTNTFCIVLAPVQTVKAQVQRINSVMPMGTTSANHDYGVPCNGKLALPFFCTMSNPFVGVFYFFLLFCPLNVHVVMGTALQPFCVYILITPPARNPNCRIPCPVQVPWMTMRVRAHVLC